MNNFNTYLFESSICIALFFVIYQIFLRRLTFFKINRFYLLFSLLLSLLIPLLVIRIAEVEMPSLSRLIPDWTVTGIPDGKSKNFAGQGLINWGGVLNIFYVAGVCVALMKFIWSLYKIRQAQRNKLIDQYGKIKIIEGKGVISNCSFFNVIFVNGNGLTLEEYQQVIKHEQYHISLNHSYDKVFIHFVQAFFWFNPFIYLYRNCVEEVHEFEVDGLIAATTGRKKYAQALLDLVLNKQVRLVNNFNSHSLKKRVRMLFVRRSRNISVLLYSIAFVALVMVMLSFSFEVSYRSDGETVKQNNTHLKNKVSDVKQLLNRDTTGSAFISRTTLRDKDNNEYDMVNIRLGENSLTGGIRKGGKILYVVNGVKLEEEDLKQFSIDKIKTLDCPCKVFIKNKGQSLIDGKYDGKIEIGIVD